MLPILGYAKFFKFLYLNRGDFDLVNKVFFPSSKCGIDVIAFNCLDVTKIQSH